MHASDESLVLRLHSAWRRASATSRGLMHEIVRAEQSVNRAAAPLSAVEMQATVYPDGRPEPGETWDEHRRRQIEADQQRAGAQSKLWRDQRTIRRSADFGE
jgi:hypothetical protein